MKRHVLSVLVENHSGVLSRVSGLFSRRGFNIDSLTVGETENPTISRMTIAVTGDDYVLEQIEKQLGKLIEVIAIHELDTQASVIRELALIKVSTKQKTRPEIVEIANIFRARIVDVSTETITIETTGDQDKIAGLIELLTPYGIKELARTGLTALDRGSLIIKA
jgi:acetolactate synthase I/III small subunit